MQIRLLASVKHPNVIRYYEAFAAGEQIIHLAAGLLCKDQELLHGSALARMPRLSLAQVTISALLWSMPRGETCSL